MTIRSKILILLSVFMLVSCNEKTKQPRLVVFLVADQLAHHSYTHYKPVFTKGYKWLNDHGINFEKAYHEHGYSGTGPGHFVLGSGLHPGPAGLIGNSWYDVKSKKNIYCIEDSSAHALDIPAYSVSYKNVNGSTFGDWLKAASPESKVYSVACKDRAAVLLGGKNPDVAIWYNWRGSFTSNSFYFDQIPSWLHDFNTEINMASYRDSVWTKTGAETLYTEYTRLDLFNGESDRYLKEPYSPEFPIGFEPEWEDKKFYGELGGRPWMDRMTLELASKAIESGELGQDDIADVLNIGLSTMDIVGHHYGPYSQEAFDLLLKQDQYIEEFLHRTDKQVGLEHVLFVLSSDHGVMPLPEYWTGTLDKKGGRINSESYRESRIQAYTTLDSLYGNHDFITRKGSRYYYDFQIMDSMAVDREVVDSVMQTALESVEGIYRVYSKVELLDSTASDPHIIRLNRFIHPEISPDLHTLLEEGWLFYSPFGTNHSTPYDYDSHIPLIFSHQHFQAISLSDSVATVDIAPTLADILGISPTNKVDGVSLKAHLVKK